MTLAPSMAPVLPTFVSGAKQLLIDGRWVGAQDLCPIEVIDPATGRVLSHIAPGGAADVDRAVTAARRAFTGEWSRWTPHQRRTLLSRVHDVVMANFDELAVIETLDVGAPLRRTRALADWTSQVLRFFAAQCDAATMTTGANSLPGTVLTLKHRSPIGVVGGVVPWNAPLISVWWTLGPALATGCTVVLKPAEEASLTVLRVAELLIEAGVPDGVVNVVTGRGPTGRALAEHAGVDRLTFAGSIGGAQSVVRASISNFKRLQLNLGGKSPDLVFADADLDKAVPGAAMGVFANSGQACVAGSRILVQRPVYDEFVERLGSFTRGLRVGEGMDLATDLGPLISRRLRDRVEQYIEIGREEGAELVCGGGRPTGVPEGGFFIEPTVFAGATNEMTVAREEIFGPVATVIPFSTVEDGLRLANDTRMGLVGGVWTRDLTTAHRVSRELAAGTVWVNCYGLIDPAIGFGGHRMSDHGWKGAREHVESHLRQQAVYIDLE
ncbi:aldehyde dehydrogenase family protein [Nocardia stercoris]|uniref:Aldehyde dehydrogenase family protein n=1 Tax=Nocardia stercoris TaxID=2483361 RepID=A0A3M2KVZ5_9NOCA|nr:aldehyde dehydrogenase family protein [Nocardia stercoris]RMI28846.1 aldehyde dehydrogenase family protein [Nocardia stercoris]